MNRHKLLWSSFCIVTIICLLSFSDNPPNGRTGAPDELSCMASGCHGNSQEFEGNIELLGFPSAAISGQTFQVVVKINATDGAPARAGFQMVALGNLGGNLINIGEFSNPGSNVRITEAGGRMYKEHMSAKFFNGAGSLSYTSNWTTPNTFNVDTITLYAASVLANGNNESSGDRVIFISKAIPVTNTVDEDGDGFNSDLDCDDTNPDINPTAMEIPNNDVDEDCDGVAQIIDVDMDGFNSDEDCNDEDQTIKPSAVEIPNNDVDENCDGIILMIDEDDDGFNSDDDCDDANPNINPGATEIPNNDIDEDCDGNNLIIDMDEDGFNSDIDCDDQNDMIHPGAMDIPGNGIDEDCSGQDGEDASLYSGQILDILNRPIANVVIIDSLSGTPLDTTDIDGTFTITSNQSNPIVINFFKESRPTEGLSSSDLVIITNHILNRVLFTNPIQIRIADVNNSGSVSSTDLVVIKQIILKNLTEFANRSPWNFDPPNLIADPANENIVIRAFKLGDVNSSASRE